MFYVFGGRDNAGEPLDVVQKYYPETYGTEDMFPILIFPDPIAQYVNVQTDIWTNRFMFHDWDWLPQEGQDINPPIVQDRPPQGGGGGGGANAAVPLNPLPVPLYGHAAVAVESTGNLFPPPVWPEGPYHYIFILGGISDAGVPVADMRWFNTSAAPGQRQGEDLQAGDYSVVSEMPVERAYHKAFAVLPDKLTNRPWRIVVFGGFDRNGNYISQVDVFTFDSIVNPVTGSWRTLTSVPEGAAGLGAGWLQDDRGFVYKQLAGRTIDGYTGSVYDVLADGSLSVAPTGLIPRGWVGSSGVVVPNDFNNGQVEGFYYLVGGLTQQGMDNIVEVYRP